jgi:CRP-like cAMP-binding protein
MFYLRALQRGLTHIVAPINPEMESTVVEFGYQAVGPVHTTPDGLVIKPMVLELEHLTSVKKVMTMLEEHRLTPILDTFDRAFFSRGERIITAGEEAHDAYVLLSGQATVRLSHAASPRSVKTLGPGALLGELALLSNRTRTADVVAEEDCDLMVMSREDFMQRLRQQPDVMASVLELVAERLADTMSRL